MSTPTKLDEVVGPLGAMDVMAVLITELLVDVLQVAEGQLGRVRGLAQSQVADPLLDHVAVGTGVHCNWPHSVLCTLSMCTATRQMHTLQTLGPLLHLSPLAIFLLAFCCSELDSLPPSPPSLPQSPAQLTGTPTDCSQCCTSGEIGGTACGRFASLASGNLQDSFRTGEGERAVEGTASHEK